MKPDHTKVANRRLLSTEEVAAARELLAAARRTPGVFAFRGRMVDAPLIRHAERLVRRADA